MIFTGFSSRIDNPHCNADVVSLTNKKKIINVDIFCMMFGKCQKKMCVC